METRPISEVLAGDYPGLRLVASVDKGDYISPMVFTDRSLDPHSLVITLDGLLTQTSFADHLKTVLKALEFGYSQPVDIEFTRGSGHTNTRGRPSRSTCCSAGRSSGAAEAEQVRFPDDWPKAISSSAPRSWCPTGRVRNITYIVYVEPEKYLRLADPSQKLELARLIGRLNQRLEGQRFILMGPGRWGSSNPDLGLKVGYADFYNTRALVEIGLAQGKNRPTLSYGTHFFQDLVEAHIYPLAIFPGEPGNPFNDKLLRRGAQRPAGAAAGGRRVLPSTSR